MTIVNGVGGNATRVMSCTTIQPLLIIIIILLNSYYKINDFLDSVIIITTFVLCGSSIKCTVLNGQHVVKLSHSSFIFSNYYCIFLLLLVIRLASRVYEEFGKKFIQGVFNS